MKFHTESGDRAMVMFRAENVDQRNPGFTLIELLVVMAIIAVLLTLVVPRYFHSVEKSKEAVLQQNLATMRDAIDKYYSDNENYPLTLEVLVEKKYLKRIPVDPVTERANTWIVVPPKEPTVSGVFDVHSGATGVAGDGRRYSDW